MWPKKYKSHSFKSAVDNTDTDLNEFVWLILSQWEPKAIYFHMTLNTYFANWLTLMNYSFDVSYCASGYLKGL